MFTQVVFVANQNEGRGEGLLRTFTQVGFYAFVRKRGVFSAAGNCVRKRKEAFASVKDEFLVCRVQLLNVFD